MTDSAEKRLIRYAQFSPELLANPYPLFAHLRSQDPAHWSEFLDGWVLTRYEDIDSVLRDSHVSINWQPPFMHQLSPEVFGEVQPLAKLFSSFVGFSDPPAHTRLRGLITKAFTPRMVEDWRPRIQEIVGELLDAVQAIGSMDVIRDLAYPLPAIVIAEMLGVPPSDRDQFKEWSDDFIDFIGTLQALPDRARRAQTSLLEMKAYLNFIIAKLRQKPRNNLMSAFVAAEEKGDRLNEEELLGTCISLLAGGHETTTNLIGNGVLALLRNDDQFQRLKGDADLVSTATEELLRYDTSVQRLVRIATTEMEIAGKRIVKGQRLLLMLGAGNRDPIQFAEPDRLDLGRQPNQHLAFAGGFHFCPGAALARAEIQVAMGTLVRRLPHMQLGAGPLAWHQNTAHRGLSSLPVTF